MSDQIERIVYFGDSLTDQGNLHALTEAALLFALPPDAFGYAGKFTDGNTFAGVVPGLLGVTDVANYAVGGARALGSRSLQTYADDNGTASLVRPGADPALLAFDFNLGAQVGRFLADTAAAGGTVDGTAASFLIGINDFGGFVPTSPQTAEAEARALAAGVVQATLGAAVAVASAGVDRIIINTLFLPSVFPGSQFNEPALVALGDLVVGGVNAALVQGAASLGASGIEASIVDTAAMVSEIAADSTSFGFVAPVPAPVLFGTGGDPVVIDTPAGPQPFFLTNPAVAGLDPDQIAFFDLVHPTAAMHGILAAFTAESLGDGVRFLGSGDDRFVGGPGSPAVLGGAGDDRVVLTGSDGLALGGSGEDFVYAGSGDDIAAGGSGCDTVFGGRGNDIVAGNSGNDALSGGTGNDVLIDGLGSDVVSGGQGRDAFLMTEAALIGGTNGADSDILLGGAGFDTLYLVLSDATRAVVEGQLGTGTKGAIAALGLVWRSVEDIIFLDDRADLAELDVAARLPEADLWGLV